jgi:spore maturation protein CgeB
MSSRYDIVVVGLTLSSSWGNGHATTFRSLLKGLDALGQRVLFLEREKPWYAAHRDLPDPDFCTLAFYDEVEDLTARFGDDLAGAGAVLVGSYVPDGVEVIDRLFRIAPRRVSFYDIDTPVTLARLERGDEEYLSASQIPHFHTYFSFTGGPTLTRLEEQFGAARAAALYCSVEPERYRHTGAAARWDLGYLGTYSPDRQPTLDRLLLEPARRLSEKRFVVAGPQYPPDIDWPDNVERIDHLPPAEHADFYSRQRFTLNVTRADMIAAGWSPSVRLFEAASVGTPIVSDHWKGLDELLPDGEAIVIARDPGDVVALLADADEERHRALAQAAREIVLEKHTGTARAMELVAALEGPAFASLSATGAGAA